MINTEEFRNLIREVVREEIGDKALYKIGEVASIGDKVTVKFSGEPEPSKKEYTYLKSYYPAIGDRVILLKDKGTYIVLGRINHKQIKHETLLWSGYAKTGSITLSEQTGEFLGLAIETNSNPATSANRGGVFIPYVLNPVAYYPVVYGTTVTWIRVAFEGRTLTINSTGNANLHITRITGVGRKSNIGIQTSELE